ncbi:MAG: phage tail protein [Acidiferrobacteraceae bacterium]
MLPNALQSNFSLGEVSPQMQGFVDLPAFKRSVLEAENFTIGPSGGLIFRQGTYYAADTRNDSACVLVPFVYNTAFQEYVLEFTDGCVRFYTQDGQLDVGFTVTGAAWATNVATLTFNTSHCWAVGDTIAVAGILPSGYNGTFAITAVTSTTVSYALATDPGAYSSGGTGTGPYQVLNDYFTTALPVSWAQDDDILYLTNGVGGIRVLTRLGNIDWTLTAISADAGPFLNINTTSSLTLTPSGTDGTTLTASAALFASTDVGRSILLVDSADSWNGTVGCYKWAVIATYVSATEVTVTQWYTTSANVTDTTTMLMTTAQSQFALGMWSNTTGYPAVLAIHQDRLIAAGGACGPTTLVGSVVGNFTTFAATDPDGTVNPDNAFVLPINAGRADAVIWMISSHFLVVGTNGQEYAVTSQGPALSPTDAQATVQTTLGGVSSMMPVQLSYRIMMMQRGGLNLQEWAYAYFVQGYMATWQNQMSSHITYPSIIWLDAVKTPSLRLYMLRSDGQLVVATDSHEAKGGFASAPGGMLGFTRYVAGGGYDGGHAVIENICVVPTSGYDQTWLCVRRTVNGVTVRHIEFLTGDFNTNPAATMANAIFVDAAQSYSGVATTTLTGLSYLQGQSVVGWDATNNVAISGTVSATGTLTLPQATKACVVGLAYTGTVKTLQVPDVAVQGKMQYPTRAYLRLYQTYNGTLLSGVDYTSPIAISESQGTLYSGMIRHDLTHGSDVDQYIIWKQVSPYPMTVLNVSLDFTVGDS